MEMIFETTEEIDDESALFKAVCSNNEKAMMNLLNQGVNTEYSGENIKTTPLQMAVTLGRLWMATTLVEYKANIHVRNYDGGTLLHNAVTCLEEWRAVFMAQMLLENGVFVDAADNCEFTALHEASQKGNYLVVDLLVRNKADVMLQTCDGQTALEIVSAIDTSKLSAPRIRFITKTKESIELEMERSEQAKQRIVAFAMGQHKRLGQFSEVLTLHPELVRMML